MRLSTFWGALAPSGIVPAWALAITGAIALAGCGGEGTNQSLEEGERLFADSGCRFCHTLEQAGASGTKGPNLDTSQPDAETVIRRVTDGGNGMPAFGEKLSADQIEALGAYVSSAATGSLAGVAAFEPDDTELSDCRPRGDTGCYEQAFANLTFEQGPAVALDLLQRRSGTDDTVAADCHRIAHSMGAAALVRFSDDVGTSFARGSAVCSSGYYHGILERSFAGVEEDELGEKAAALCNDGILQRQPFLAFQCRHGLGHGLMIETGYELPVALDACDALNVDQRAACHDGVFMENFSSSYGVSSDYLRDDDLLYPCNDVVSERKYSCYIIVTGRIYDVLGSWKATAEECRAAEPDWQYVCFRSFGRDAISRNSYDQGTARRLCKLTREWEGECVLSVALHIANEERGLRGAARFCRSSQVQLRVYCYTGLGITASVLIPDPNRRQRDCDRLTSDPREAFACSTGQFPA